MELRMIASAVLFVAAAAVACGGGSKSARTDSADRNWANAEGAGNVTCPNRIPGTDITVEDREDGAAIKFVTRSDQVDRLRQSVRQFAGQAGLGGGTGPGSMGGGMQGEHGWSPGGTGTGSQGGYQGGQGTGGAGPGAGGNWSEPFGTAPTGRVMPGSGQAGGVSGMLSIPNADARIQDIDRGSRVVFLARDPSVIDEVRSDVRREADRLRAGDCPAGDAGMGTGMGDRGGRGQGGWQNPGGSQGSGGMGNEPGMNMPESNQSGPGRGY